MGLRVLTAIKAGVVTFIVLSLAACGGGGGGGGGGGNPGPFTVSGTVSGLSGTGMVLQDNGGDNLAISANGTFTFAQQIANGASYKVTVLTQPSGPVQTCTVN